MNNNLTSAELAVISEIEATSSLLRLVTRLTGLRFAAIAKVTEASWTACAVYDEIQFGLEPGHQLKLETTFCNELRQHRQPIVINEVATDPVYAEHPITKMYGFQSYFSLPIIFPNGDFFGTLCAIDTVPAHFDETAVLKTLGLFAQLIAMHLDLSGDLEKSENALADATEAGRLREQFIAVLGHDLRTPLSAIRMSADLLESRLSDRRERGLASAIRKSSQRMGALIEDVLDFARGKLGGGIPVRRTVVDDLESVFDTVLAEIQASEPDARINRSMTIASGVYCDPARIGQLLSNLLGNAVKHGDRKHPVEVVATTDGSEFVLSVANQGASIPATLIPLLFQPFKRSEGGQRGEGLGLGLYIAAQILEGHNGTLSVSSSPDQGTCFVARFPVRLEKV